MSDLYLTVLEKTLFREERLLVDPTVRNGLLCFVLDFFVYATNPELIQADDIHVVLCRVI